MFRSNAVSIPAQVQFQVQSLPPVLAPTTFEVSPFTRMAAPSPIPPPVPRLIRELRGEFEEEMEGAREREIGFDWEHVD